MLALLGAFAVAVDGRPDLGMVIYNPATSADADKIRSLVRLEAAAHPLGTRLHGLH